MISSGTRTGNSKEARRKAVGSPPSDPRPAIVAGLIVLIVCIGGFAAWASISQIESAVLATGELQVRSKRKTVQHLDGGIVRELLVSNGDMVEEGQLLLRLDKTTAAANAELLQIRHDAARIALARLKAELALADEMEIPVDLRQRAAKDASLGELLEGQTRLFVARRDSLEGQLTMIREQVGQLEEQIAGLTSLEASRTEQINLLDEEIVDLRQLLEKGYTPKARVLALERERARLAGEKGDNRSAIAQARLRIAAAQMEVNQVRREFLEQVADEFRTRQQEMFDVAERLAAAQFTLEMTDIRATASGIVVGLNVHTVGAVIPPGGVLLEIVPGNETLVIETHVRPVDIDEVSMGQVARIILSAFSSRTTPQLVGEVTYVSADALSDPDAQQKYYLVRVEVSEAETAKLGGQILQPGMPVEVMIRTGARTPLSFLLQPIEDSMRRAWREG